MSLFSTDRSFLYKGETGGDVPVHTTHLTVHESVESIPKDAFRHCRELREVHLPEGLKSIGEEAFKGCVWLKRINLPASLTTIPYNAFSDCDIVEISSAASIYPSRMQRMRTILKSSKKTIQPYEFRNKHSLIEVNLPDSIETIGQSAFACCSKLRSLRIPPSVTILKRNTFDSCKSLLSLELPEELSTIENFTLYSGLDSLRNIATPVKCIVGERNGYAVSGKQRFEGLPIHKLCYYKPESLVQYLNQPMNSLKEKRALTTGMLQDKLGMTPLHILACSTRQNIEMYQLLLELYPENLITKDKWGELPLLYAFWSNAPKDILQLLVKSHKEFSPAHNIDWGGIVTTLGKHNVTPICIYNVLDMYNSLCLNNVDWEAIVIGLAQSEGTICCGKATIRFIMRSVLAKRLNSLGVGKRQDKMMEEVDSWRYHHERLGLFKMLFSKLKTYEYQHEVASLLELALWKAKIDQNESNIDDDKKKKAKIGEDRLESRVSSGADIIVPNVVAFLFRETKQVKGPSTSSAEDSESNSEQDGSDSDEDGSDSEEEGNESDSEDDGSSDSEANDEIESDVLHEEASAESRPVDTRHCAICRNSNNEPSIEYQANPSRTNDNGLSITYGNCGHVFHLDCIQRWLKARSVCPLCNEEWEFTKIERIPGYAASDGEEAEVPSMYII